ncbi:aminoglycoside 6-adenylyltransferase [Metasolibacillus sp.]|uniref:aminoglycoside 6-adenylyltransferase n=1 Tax=Metasolibacillus sp. TaxID=2703680 RepID=UPI0025DE4623|nr:aminoglycoside 6-adenylyltransferase [Metasolibacillus sp.]MCT6925335.1 aminoglycoside 6-adenylyltransferase [Metasolibacillus sp.]MCT6941637.1 aminoglycoside 6-adenylyltransferase [Metasolibacillus sp.]
MRSEVEMFQLFSDFASQDERIRISVLEGSRTNRNIPQDHYQDYDISFFVTSMDSYLENDDWLQHFGELVFVQKPEDMELFPPDFENWFTYILYFADGIKIDLSLIPLTELKNYFQSSDGLVEVLLDKDKRISQEVIATDEKYWIQKPSARSFDDCCNEFWSVATYVAKGLRRNEFLFAIDHLHNNIRQELLRMMSWDIGIRQGFTFSVGKNYKFIQQHLAPEVYEKLLRTYTTAGIEQTWLAFELCCDMFRDISHEVAEKLGYAYPSYDKNITAWIDNTYKKGNN